MMKIILSQIAALLLLGTPSTLFSATEGNVSTNGIAGTNCCHTPSSRASGMIAGSEKAASGSKGADGEASKKKGNEPSDSASKGKGLDTSKWPA